MPSKKKPSTKTAEAHTPVVPIVPSPSPYAKGMQKLRANRAIFNYCRECAVPTLAEKPGGYYCKAHNDARRGKVRERMQKLRADRKAAGLCPECGQPSPEGTCEKCRARKRR